jgi:phosphoribosylaminoimidazole (AIR) synthetase
MLVEPSKSYAKTIARIHGWLPDGKITKPIAKIAGVYHVTGGGIMEKVKGALPPGIGLNLKTMPNPADLLLLAQNMSRRFPKLTLSDWKAHRTLNGGCGMFVIAETEADAKIVIEEARKDGIEAGIAGETTVSDVNEIIIHSRFLEGKLLSSEDPE